MGARENLRLLLSQFDLGDLTDTLYRLYTEESITDIPTLLLAVEDTVTYQERFAGIRDPRTGQKLMSERDYVDYENFVMAQFTARGLPPPSRAEVGSIVQSRRSPAELAQDFQAYDALRESPFVRDQFYLYSGMDPGPEGLLAAVVGLAPDIEKVYERAINGIQQSVYQQRLEERLQHPDTALTTDLLAAGPDGTFTAIDFSSFAIPRVERLRAVRQAMQANEARFKAGGTAGPQQAPPTTRQPYTF